MGRPKGSKNKVKLIAHTRVARKDFKKAQKAILEGVWSEEQELSMAPVGNIYENTLDGVRTVAVEIMGLLENEKRNPLYYNLYSKAVTLLGLSIYPRARQEVKTGQSA